MASINEEEAAARNINPLLLVAARGGFWKLLELLFDREDRQEPPMMIPTDEFRVLLDATDAELGVNHQPASLSAGALLKGVTLDGDTALHVVASNGNDQDFWKCAGMICGRDRGLPYAKNNNGDTPFHCAIRAGNCKMASHLIDLAGREAAPRNINPLLLLSARVGSWKALDFLFQQVQNPPMMIPTDYFHTLLELDNRTIPVPAARDVEEGVTPDPYTVLTARDGGEGVTPDRDTARPARGGGEGVTPDRDTATPARGGGEGVGQPAALLSAARELLKGVTPDGDTALHAVASNGDGDNFQIYAHRIWEKDWGLLFAKNHNGDTPLHCAARAGNSKMVSCLIYLAGCGVRDPDRKLTLLRMENNRQETALHEAIRIEHGRIMGPKDRKALFQTDRATTENIRDFVGQQNGMTIVKQLMADDSKLANYPADGISPLYLAIFLGKSTIALTLYCESRCDIDLSYSGGADGQNALHVAVLRHDTVMIELLLDWKRSLTTQVDKDGSTPLHFASSMFFPTTSYLRPEALCRPPWCRFVRIRTTQALPEVLRANPAAQYQADKNGFFPVHVAASAGDKNVIRFFLHERPDNAGLRDPKGKTFLHVAIEKRRLDIVSYVCGKASLARILNMQDNDGNTALHLAIQAGSFEMFCTLFRNPNVNWTLRNNQGETPRDVSRSLLPLGMWYYGKSEHQIYDTLRLVGANHGDKNEETYILPLKPEDEDKDSERLKDATQRYIVASVLIANMAFSGTFGIPGGYRADDHTKGGTPTLAGGLFDAFIMATALTFICSVLATTGFMLAGVPMVNLITRKEHLRRSELLFSGSVVCISIAFALGVYMVLAPVAQSIAIVICVLSAITPYVVVRRHFGFLSHLVNLAKLLYIRKRLFRGMVPLLGPAGVAMVIIFVLFIVIFGPFGVGISGIPFGFLIVVWAGWRMIQWINNYILG